MLRNRALMFGLLCMLFVASCQRRTDIAEATKLAAKDRIAGAVLPFLKARLVGDVQISPQGTYLAIRVPQEDHSVLMILRISDKAVINSIAFKLPEMVGGYSWVSDTRVVIAILAQRGSLEIPLNYGELYSVDVTKKRGRIIFGARAGEQQTGSHVKRARSRRAWASVIDLLPDDPEHILISSQPYSKDREINPTIYRLGISRGRTKTIATSPVANAYFVADPSGQVRFAIGTDDKGQDAAFYRESSNSTWQRMEKLKGFSKKSRPLRFLCDNNTVLVRDWSSSDVAGYYTVDIATGERKEIFQHEEVEPYDMLIDPVTCTIAAVEYHPDYPTYQFVNEQHQLTKTLKALIGRFTGSRVQITSITRDGKLAVALVSGDRNPGRYYVVDVSSQKATPVYDRLQGRLSTRLSEMRAFMLKARDGLKLTGYITFPAGEGERDLPMVVVPHGGPHFRREFWGYDPEAQLLASQGFAVMQLNFRGSWGFGRKFQRAGFREWGGKVQEDIIDATRWAISQGIANKDRICIYGASFGAYSAMQSTILAPDLFRCAVGYAGAYDLNLIYKSGIISESKRDVLHYEKAIGRDTAQLEQLSPAYNADKINIPVFLAHGGKDESTPIEHAENMKEALDKRGIEYEWMVKPKEGHGFVSIANQVEFYTRLIKFLRKHIQPELLSRRSAARDLAETDFSRAFKHTRNNREEIEKSHTCGCYFCSHIFKPAEIKEWKGDKNRSAACPKCGTDSVLGSASGYPITKAFLKALREYWLKHE